MGRDILVDGYNIIKNSATFRTVETRNFAAARAALLTQLVSRYRHTPHRVIVVFDGDGASEQVSHERRICIIYSRHNETADSVIARLATEAITRYVSSTLRSYHAAGSATDEEFLAALRAAALEAHDAVLAESATRNDKRKMATTLTVAIAVWPWLYVTQVGDSRLYYHANGILRQITRDQTVGQELVDQGVIPADRLHKSPLRNVLSRAIGSDEALPEVTLVDVSERACTLLLCSDGLTKHVTDADIAAALATPRSSRRSSWRPTATRYANGCGDN